MPICKSRWTNSKLSFVSQLEKIFICFIPNCGYIEDSDPTTNPTEIAIIYGSLGCLGTSDILLGSWVRDRLSSKLPRSCRNPENQIPVINGGFWRVSVMGIGTRGLGYKMGFKGRGSCGCACVDGPCSKRHAWIDRRLCQSLGSSRISESLVCVLFHHIWHGPTIFEGMIS